MFLQSYTSVILGLSTLAYGFAVPAPLNPRAASTCNADNCLRAFRATSPSSRIADASSFCSSYLSTSVPANTQYTTTTTTTTVTAATQTITGSTIVVTTTTSEATITIATLGYLSKRQPDASTPPSLPQTYPAYASQCGPNSQAARISSACSCLLKSAGTTTATVTATATTSTTPLTTSTPTTTTTLTTITGTGTITEFAFPNSAP